MGRERVMDRKKYIVEASDDVKKVMAIGVTRGGAIWTDTTDIENLEELNSDYINEHYSDLQDTAYQKGFEDGKKSKEKGCDGCRYESKWQKENPCKDCSNCYKSQYEPMPKDEICFGDEIVDEYGEKGIVVSRNNADEWIYVLFKGYAVPQKIYKSNCRKTGVRRNLDSYFEET
jgi:hypothetical protein